MRRRLTVILALDVFVALARVRAEDGEDDHEGDLERDEENGQQEAFAAHALQQAMVDELVLAGRCAHALSGGRRRHD